MWGGGERGDQLHQLFSLGRNRAGKLLELQEVLVLSSLKAELGTDPAWHSRAWKTRQRVGWSYSDRFI